LGLRRPSKKCLGRTRLLQAAPDQRTTASPALRKNASSSGPPEPLQRGGQVHNEAGAFRGRDSQPQLPDPPIVRLRPRSSVARWKGLVSLGRESVRENAPTSRDGSTHALGRPRPAEKRLTVTFA
jgi:hypothetical protein